MTLIRSCRKTWTVAFLLVLLGFGDGSRAASPAKDAAELQLALDKLQVLGSVLYIAAHPDDENTSALAYFSKDRKLRPPTSP